MDGRPEGGATVSDRGKPVLFQRCSIPDCGAPHKAKGLCGKHYERQRVWGYNYTAYVVMPSGTTECRVKGCESKRGRNGSSLCERHAYLHRRYGTTNPIFTCKCCGEEYPFDNGSKCKLCESCYTISRYFGNRQSLDVRILWIVAFREQNGICKICHQKGERRRGRRELVVDHDHSCPCNKAMGCAVCFRGLICDRCNMHVGWYETINRQAIEEYLYGPVAA